ncbi:MAG: D-alanine--D-alanine ligase family protein [Planctomycetota bacterium]
MTVVSSTSSKPFKPISQLNVSVLAGGIGEERAVSLKSGECISQALNEEGVNTKIEDIRPDHLNALDFDSTDVFFLALHGKFGEDGQLQAIMEQRSLIYTGSGPEASRLAFDKMAGKEKFQAVNVNTPGAFLFDPDFSFDKFQKQVIWNSDKFVIKPIRQGSSVGVSIIDGLDAAFETAIKVHKEFGDCMIEQHISGSEITVGILCGQALPIIEIRPKEAFYNYHSKYVDEQTDYLFDTISEDSLVSAIQQDALNCFNALGCRDFGRVDFILGEDGIAYALEINTIPGFTTHSLLPKAARKNGLSMGQLCVKIIKAAIENKS